MSLTCYIFVVILMHSSWIINEFWQKIVCLCWNLVWAIIWVWGFQLHCCYIFIVILMHSSWIINKFLHNFDQMCRDCSLYKILCSDKMCQGIHFYVIYFLRGSHWCKCWSPIYHRTRGRACECACLFLQRESCYVPLER